MYDGRNLSSRFHKSCWQRVVDNVLASQPKPKPAKPKEVGVKCHECQTWVYRATETVKNTLFTFLITASILGILGGLGTLAATALLADSHVTFCYVDYNTDPSYYSLMGNIEWGQDRTISKRQNLDDVITDAQKLGCPIRKDE
jgi:hypothetical protein